MSTVSIADRLISALTEGWDDTNLVDPRTRYNDAPGFAWMSRRFGFYTTQDMRADGRHAPVYDNEFDLKAIRWSAWLMDASVPVAKTMKNRLTDYTIASGFDYTITHPSNRIEAIANSIVKSFLDNSRWHLLERQSFETEIVDGEFIAPFEADGMDITMEPIQGDQLQEPIETRDLEDWKGIDFPCSWSFGVCTKINRTRPQFYHIVRNLACTDFDVIPACEFVHWTRNAPTTAKRGFSDHYLTHKIVKHGSTVLERTAIGSAIQASIAYIIEHAPGTTPSQIAAFANQRNNVVVKPNTLGQQERTREFGAGEIIETKSGQKYQAGLLGSNASDIYIKVMEACFRIAGTPYAFPEHFLTGYAGNNNLASSLTAQDPFVQGRLADQQVRSDRFEHLLRDVVRFGLKQLKGRLNIDETDIDRICRQLDIAIQKPEIVSQKDNSALVSSLVTQIENKLIDRASAINQLGYDIESVEQGIADQAEKDAQGKPQQPGQPGVAGALGQAGRRQFTNNRKAIDDITSDLQAGTITPEKASALLSELGLSADTIKVLVDQEGTQEGGQGELTIREDSEVKLGCIMLEAPAAVSDIVKQMQLSIPEVQLLGDGYEEWPHVTVLYGIVGTPIEEVVAMVRKMPPIDVVFGNLSVFDCEEYSVLKAEVESQVLREWNQRIKDAFPMQETHPDYQPHMTIAYMDAEAADSRRGPCELTGVATTFTHAVVSLGGKKVRISLASTVEPVSAALAGVSDALISVATFGTKLIGNFGDWAETEQLAEFDRIAQELGYEPVHENEVPDLLELYPGAVDVELPKQMTRTQEDLLSGWKDYP